MMTCAPGPSAVLTALALGGLPTDAFFFAGFLPNAKAARRAALEKLSECRRDAGVLRIAETGRRDAAGCGTGAWPDRPPQSAAS